ncbi:hypothetical protein IE81DRAFT_321298 [Ceraceosorus guamensis]|uniref:Nucleoporin Nup120/160-domain-containing protein n=1 Tax=Ceraceosorus guamensis TaxID=1522189 RepID=A0A316W3D7_9BASI|nr:hypothetical protein IE81DRAFT_321298 [Ceraceosorus guamensis]PWN44407.1 hypothetical protein IE81DRAFT_321298 [Ceraceosorus guamensis]
MLLHVTQAPLWLLGGSGDVESQRLLGVPSQVPASTSSAPQQPLGSSLGLADGSLIVLRTLPPAILEIRFIPSSRLPEDGKAPAFSQLAQPILLRFPSPILPEPSVWIDARQTLHIVAATSTALHRVSFTAADLSTVDGPHSDRKENSTSGGSQRREVPNTAPRSKESAQLKREWHAELALDKVQRIHACEEGRVVVQCANGLLIAEQNRAGDGSGAFEGPWRTTDLRAGSFFRTLTRYFARPAPTSPGSSNSQNASSAPAPISSDRTALSIASARSSSSNESERNIVLRSAALQSVSLVFSVHADARLRIWDIISASCIREIALPASAHPSDVNQPLQSFPPNALPQIKAYSTSHNIRLLIHVPAASRRFFACFDVSLLDAPGAVGDVSLAWTREEDSETKRIRLADMHLGTLQEETDEVYADTSSETLWGVWEDEVAAHIAWLPLNAMEAPQQDNEDAHCSWSSAYVAQAHPPLHGPSFDRELEASDDVPSFFLKRILHTSRFAPYLASTLDTYASALSSNLDPSATRPPALRGQPVFQSIAERIASTVAAGVQLRTDSHTGSWRTDAFQAAVAREWTAFSRALEARAAEDQAPLAFLPSETATPRLLLAGAIGTLSSPDAASLLARCAESEHSKTAAKGRAVLRAAIEQDNLQKRVEASGLFSRNEARTRAHWQLVTAAARFEAALGTNASLSFQKNLELALDAVTPLDVSLVDLGDSLMLDLQPEMADLHAVREVCASLGDDLLRALDDFGKLLCSGTGDRRSGSSELAEVPTRLHAALLADATQRSLLARERVARSFVLFLVALAQLDPLDNLDTGAHRAIRARAIVSLHDIGTLVELLQISGETEVDVQTFQEAQPNDADAVVQALGDMSMEATRHTSALHRARPKLHGATSGLLHRLILCGFLPLLDATHPGAAAGELLRESRWLDPAALHATAETLIDDLRTEAHLTEPHVRLAAQLLSLGLPSAALTMVDRYESCAASHFARGSALAALGEAGLASHSFELVATWLCSHDDLFMRDDEDGEGADLALLLPQQVREATPGDSRLATFYAHTSDILMTVSPSQAAYFAEKALSLPPTPHSIDMHARVFAIRLSEGDFAGAHALLLTAPRERSLNDLLRQLVGAMCESGEVHQLLAFSFPTLQPEMERTLAFKARNSDPIGEPNYYYILYAYHIHRGDLKSAGATMYQHAQHLASLQRERSTLFSAQSAVDAFSEVAILQARSYLAACNVLALVPERDAWFGDAALGHDEDEDDLLPYTLSTSQARKPRQSQTSLTSYVPDELWSNQTQEIKIVSAGDVKRRYRLTLAHLELLQLYPEFATTATHLDSSNVVLLYTRNDQYDKAISVARALQVDMSGIFNSLATKCVGLAQGRQSRLRAQQSSEIGAKALHPLMAELRDDEDADGDEGEAAFLISAERSAGWQGPAADRAWRYLQLHLEAQDARASQWKYRVVVLERVLGLGAAHLIPKWLLDWFKQNQPTMLVQSCMRCGLLDDALRHANSMVKEAQAKRLDEHASSSWLPYNLIDTLLQQSEDPNSRPPHGSSSATATRELAQALRSSIREYVEELERKEREMRRYADKAELARSRKLQHGGDPEMEWAP